MCFVPIEFEVWVVFLYVTFFFSILIREKGVFEA